MASVESVNGFRLLDRLTSRLPGMGVFIYGKPRIAVFRKGRVAVDDAGMLHYWGLIQVYDAITVELLLREDCVLTLRVRDNPTGSLLIEEERRIDDCGV